MSKDNNNPNTLAVIGASGAGKTVLAIGLYATSMSTFTVSSIGDETRKYIEVRQNALLEGYWPAATNESDNIDLRLRLYANGKQTDIVFREYMGERMEKDPNYICDVVGTPKAAMVLFNPGMSGLQNVESRNRMLGNLKVIAQHLKDNGCVAVALVVTASDRLTSDLADFREAFEQYVSLITDYLEALQLNWKRFDVTVSGELVNQNKPQLAYGKNNTTHKPFLWLLGCISVQRLKRRIKKIIAWTTGIVFCMLAVWGCLWVKSKSDLSDILDKVDCIETKIVEAWEIKNEADVRMEFAKLQDLVTNTLPGAFKIPPGNPKTARMLATRLSDDIDLWNVRLLALEYNANKHDSENNPLRLQEGWAKSFDAKLTGAKPSAINAIEELSVLKEAWQENRLPMEEKWQVAKFKDEVERMIVDLKKAKEDSLPIRLKKGYDFLKNTSYNYPLVENCDTLANDLRVARANALAKYCDFITKKWDVNGSLPPEFDIRQVLSTELTDDVITSDEKKIVEEEMQTRFEKAKDDWMAAQKKICDSFVSSYLYSTVDALGALNNYMEFRNINLANPFLDEVDQRMANLLEARIDWLVAEYNRNFRTNNSVWFTEVNRSMRMQEAQNNFNELRMLCLAIKNEMLAGSTIQSSWVDRFASLCIEHGGIRRKGINAAFLQEFSISAIDVKVDFDSTISNFEKLDLGIEIGERYWNDGVKNSMWESLIKSTSFYKSEDGKFRRIWNGSKMFSLNPWTHSYVKVTWEAYIDWAPNPTGNFSRSIWSEKIEDGCIQWDGHFTDRNNCNSGRITIRVHGTLTGFDIRTLLRQAKEN